MMDTQLKEKHHDPPSRIIPWVEKYRPTSVSDVAHQDEVVKTLQSAIATGTLPHLLLYGPPGTGKTSTILAVARSLFGPAYRTRILELNASDERGIKVVREKVKQFAQFTVSSLERVSGYPCPPFKIVILDEADTMTSEAQAALRRTIEAYSKITRFCLLCNYVTRIIEPLASRCAKLRFRPLSSKAMEARIRSIADAERVAVAPQIMQAILELSKGDMRRAVTTFQSACQFYGKVTEITPSALLEMAGGIPDQVLSSLWDAIYSHDFSTLEEQVKNVELEGYATMSVLHRLFDIIVGDPKVSLNRKRRQGINGSVPTASVPPSAAEPPQSTHL